MLLHLVDAAGEDPVEAWRVVRGELEAYGAGLDDKPEVLALSRADLVEPKADGEAGEEARQGQPAAEPFVVSAATGDGLEPLLDAILDRRRRREAGRGRADPTNASGRRFESAAVKLALTGGTGFVGAHLLDAGARRRAMRSARSTRRAAAAARRRRLGRGRARPTATRSQRWSRAPTR